MKDEHIECIFDDLTKRVIDETIDITLTKIRDFKYRYVHGPEHVILPIWIKSIVKSSNVFIPSPDEKQTFCGLYPIFTESKTYLHEIEVI